ncbi:MAG TPA: CBS domain-containing protein [Anaerolineales bacterium]|nr:CBS domain-containing protein [Anaerolineales bacterium]
MNTSSDVMTRNPVCAHPQDTVASVAQLMKERDIGPIPIVVDDDTKRVVGIVTDRDLAMKVVAEGRDPNTTQVREVMTREVVTARDDEDIHNALDAMSQHQLRRILVVDGENRLVGIIAQADIATRMNEPEKTGEVVKDISE